MKRLAFIIGLATMLILFISCSETEPSVLAEGEFEMSMTANLPDIPYAEGDDELTKAISQYMMRIYWSKGDKLSVVNLSTGKLLGGNLTANSDGVSSTFSGALNGTVNNGDRIAFFYPGSNNASEEPFTGFHIDMSSQLGTMASVPLCTYSITTASSNTFQDTQISFSLLMSYIMIGMSDLPVSTLIQSLTLTNLNNQFDLSINAAKTGFDIAPQQGNIKLTPAQTATGSGVRTIYAAVPGSTATSRKAVLETPTTTFETSFTGATISNGYAYNTNLSGFLVDDMTFEDPLVREYCLSHFDLNGDGRLSLIEIASITSFPSAPLPDDIRCFDELEFFYGLTTLPSMKNQKYLASVTIPKQITHLQDELFSGCSSLKEVTMMPKTPPTLGSNVFSGVPGDIIIIVADGSYDAYQNAAGWNSISGNICSASVLSGSNVRIRTEGETMGNDNVNVNI